MAASADVRDPAFSDTALNLLSGGGVGPAAGDTDTGPNHVRGVNINAFTG
jgi:hypothetical protein